VPHPRSENTKVQTSLPAIENIDFLKFDMILLGGDLGYYTSRTSVSMNHFDSLYNFKSPNTLWAMGNHDVENRSLIKDYTGRPSYYTYYRDNITFFVMDVELDATGFTKSFISGDQLKLLNSVCDTISQSKYLIIIHGRLLWMIGNKYLKTKLDSVAESTKQLDTTNFYQVVYPLLQKVKKNKVQVLCLGGDKSRINLQYSPEDSITFLTSTMAPEFADSLNDVLTFDFDKKTNNLSYQFVRLDKVEKKKQIISKILNTNNEKLNLLLNNSNKTIQVCLQANESKNYRVEIFSIDGICAVKSDCLVNSSNSIKLTNSGMYLIRINYKNRIITRKIIVN
jgi:hypothetical protein